jgi:hypothetical protein
MFSLGEWSGGGSLKDDITVGISDNYSGFRMIFIAMVGILYAIYYNIK